MVFDILVTPASQHQHLQQKGCTCSCECGSCNCSSTNQVAGRVGRAVALAGGDSGARAIDPPKALDF